MSSLLSITNKEKNVEKNINKVLLLKKNICNLPQDLIYNIMSFSCVEYKNALKKVHSKIKTNKKINQLILYLWHYNNLKNDSYFSVIHFCNKVFSKKTLIELQKECNKCYCCTRHSHYKPKNMMCLNSNPNKIIKSEDENNITCHCNCRHLSRAYWKAYNL